MLLFTDRKYKFNKWNLWRHFFKISMCYKVNVELVITVTVCQAVAKACINIHIRPQTTWNWMFVTFVCTKTIQLANLYTTKRWTYNTLWQIYRTKGGMLFLEKNDKTDIITNIQALRGQYTNCRLLSRLSMIILN